ncbi:MAG: hypothetical protein IJC88_01755 [Oscillospiraceae bacterium]|nr:hypothetical protein [Oscillospiraceae bacterium]
MSTESGKACEDVFSACGRQIVGETEFESAELLGLSRRLQMGYPCS